MGAIAVPAFAQKDDGGYGPPIPPKVAKKTNQKPGVNGGKVAPISDGPSPVMVLPETDWSWDDVMQGDKVSHTFVVKNTGEGVLRITQVKPGCGCTSKSFDREIAPGGEGKIDLVIDTTKLKGKTVRKYATIFTNDPRSARAKVFMSGSVTPFILTEPASVRLIGLSGDLLEGSVTVSPGPKSAAFSIESVKAKGDRVEIVEVKDLGDGRYNISVKAVPSDRPQVLRDQLTVAVVDSEGVRREANVPVTVEHRDRITLQPRGNVVFQKRETARLLQEGAAKRPVQRDVHIFGGRDDIKFNLLNVELLDLPEGVFTVTTNTVKPEHRYRISIRLNEYRQERTLRGRLRITTDDPETPVREMRVYAQFGGTTNPRVTGAGANNGKAKPVPAIGKGKAGTNRRVTPVGGQKQIKPTKNGNNNSNVKPVKKG